MTIENDRGYVFVFTEKEMQMLRAVAERDGITPEEAIQKAIQNFLSRGVQTPNGLKKTA